MQCIYIRRRTSIATLKAHGTATHGSRCHHRDAMTADGGRGSCLKSCRRRQLRFAKDSTPMVEQDDVWDGCGGVAARRGGTNQAAPGSRAAVFFRERRAVADFVDATKYHSFGNIRPLRKNHSYGASKPLSEVSPIATRWPILAPPHDSRLCRWNEREDAKEDSNKGALTVPTALPWLLWEAKAYSIYSCFGLTSWSRPEQLERGRVWLLP